MSAKAWRNRRRRAKLLRNERRLLDEAVRLMEELYPLPPVHGDGPPMFRIFNEEHWRLLMTDSTQNNECPVCLGNGYTTEVGNSDDGPDPYQEQCYECGGTGEAGQ